VSLRGETVGILCILIEVETGKEFTFVTLQPRVSSGFAEFPELPAGKSMDSVRMAVQELSEVTLLEIKESELYDLTHLAYKGRYSGVYSSSGITDEVCKVFLYRRNVGRDVLKLLRLKHSGDIGDRFVKYKLIPFEDLWRETPDAKAQAALHLYYKFQQLKVYYPPSPQQFVQEDHLKQILSPRFDPKITRNKKIT